MALLARCLLLALCVVGSRCVVTGLTQSQQFEDTAMYSATCDQASGAFIVEIYNGYLTPQTIALSGYCDGILEPLSASPLQVRIEARQNATGYLYGPATSSKSSLSIYGAQCVISMALVANPATNLMDVTKIIQSIPAVCGPFSAGSCDCPGFWSLRCWVNNCNGAESGFLWGIIAVSYTVLATMVYGVVVITQMNKHLTKHHSFRSNLTLSRGTQLQKKVDKFTTDVRNGTLTRNGIEVQIRAINMDLVNPKYLELRRLEYVNPAGKKFTGMESEDIPLVDNDRTSVEMHTFADHSENSHVRGYVDAYARPNARTPGKFADY